MIKKITIVIILGFVTLLAINARTPFFIEDVGPWSIGYGHSDKINDIPVQTAGIIDAKYLDQFSPGSEFLADPFFVHHRDSFYLFFEHKKFKPHKASIGLLTSADGKNYQYKGTVLEESFHLSYPQVFKYKEEFYMLPETKNAGHVLLYKATNFPHGWVVNDTLLKNVYYKDPSIYLSDTLNIMVASDDHLTMRLFKAKSLNEDWREVKVILQGSEARAGGRIFNHDGKLYLPVQSCAEGYGTHLSLYEFVFDGDDVTLRKNQHKFLKAQEKIAAFSRGMHHLDQQEVNNRYYSVFDGSRETAEKKSFVLKYPLKLTAYDLLNIRNR